MNRPTVSKLLAAIPERSVRAQSGALFVVPDAAAENAAKIAYVAQFLQWLTPLHSLTKEDQQALGLLAANGRAAVLDDDDELEAEEIEPAAARRFPEPAVV